MCRFHDACKLCRKTNRRPSPAVALRDGLELGLVLAVSRLRQHVGVVAVAVYILVLWDQVHVQDADVHLTDELFNYRIKFKLSTPTYRALAIHQPPYLASLLHFSNITRQLRSSTSQHLSIPRTKLNLGKRAFSVAAPIIWNELPTT